MDTEKAIDRIKKLLALAESSEPYEAAQAMGRAQELMTRYRVDAARVREEGAAPIEAVVDDNLFAIVGKRRVTWKGRLARAIGDANGLRVYTTWTSHDGEYVMAIKAIGQPGVARVAAFAYHFVAAEIERMAQRHRGRGRVWTNNFRMGAAHEVAKRLEEETARDLPPEAEGEEGLVPTNALATIEAEIERQAQRLGLRAHHTRGSRYHEGAWAAGRAAGGSIEVRNGARGALTAA